MRRRVRFLFQYDQPPAPMSQMTNIAGTKAMDACC